jgi:hypothetical protein
VLSLTNSQGCKEKKITYNRKSPGSNRAEGCKIGNLGVKIKRAIKHTSQGNENAENEETQTT